MNEWWRNNAGWHNTRVLDGDHDPVKLREAMEAMWQSCKSAPTPDCIIVPMRRVTRRWRGKKFSWWSIQYFTDAFR